MDHRSRVRELAAAASRRGIELVLLFDRDNVRYFTGFRLNRAVFSILALSADGEPTYVVARLDAERARRECWIERIAAFAEDTPNYLFALRGLLGRDVRRIGVERDALTLQQAEAISEVAGGAIEFIDARPLTTVLRLRKDDEEIARIRRAAEVADRVMDEIRGMIVPGRTEIEVVGAVERSVREHGAEGTSFEPFLMSGDRAWLPQRVATERRLRDGEMAILDMGAVVDGYSSDLTRTFSVGSVNGEKRRLFDVALDAHDAAIEAVRPGACASDVDRAARAVIAAAGLSEYFPHLTGHGVGVSTHEPPIVDEGVEDVLESGMVMTIEPGVYVPGIGAARVEDMVLVTGDGHDVLTRARRGLS